MSKRRVALPSLISTNWPSTVTNGPELGVAGGRITGMPASAISLSTTPLSSTTSLGDTVKSKTTTALGRGNPGGACIRACSTLVRAHPARAASARSAPAANGRAGRANRTGDVMGSADLRARSRCGVAAPSRLLAGCGGRRARGPNPRVAGSPRSRAGAGPSPPTAEPSCPRRRGQSSAAPLVDSRRPAGAPWPRQGQSVNPDVVGAIERLREAGVLERPQAAFFERVARRELVSVRLEIRLLLYAGVLCLTSGVGLLLALHHDEIGPAAIAAAIGLAALGCLTWVARAGAPFSWG